MNCAYASACKHCNGCFRDHWHIDDHTVTFSNALGFHDVTQCLCFDQQVAVCEGFLVSGDGAVINDGRLISAAIFDMAVYTVVTGVAGCACEPSSIDTLIGVKGFGCRCEPVYFLCSLCPEPFRVVLPTLIYFRVFRCHVKVSSKPFFNSTSIWGDSKQIIGSESIATIVYRFCKSAI